MHQINDAVVKGGQLILSDLPFAEGQHVRVFVAEVAIRPTASIHEIRRTLKGGVEHFDDPFEPLIPNENWEMLR
jgi:hypothetical protein